MKMFEQFSNSFNKLVTVSITVNNYRDRSDQEIDLTYDICRMGIPVINRVEISNQPIGKLKTETNSSKIQKITHEAALNKITPV